MSGHPTLIMTSTNTSIYNIHYSRNYKRTLLTKVIHNQSMITRKLQKKKPLDVSQQIVEVKSFYPIEVICMGFKVVEYKVQIQIIFLSFERPLELPKAICFDLHARFSIILHRWKSIQ